MIQSGSPTLVCFTGPPGAGKSFLARAVAERLGLPLFDRDDFKDMLFDTLGWSDREWSKKIGAASWAVLEAVASTLVTRKVSAVLDSNFRPSDRIVAHLNDLAAKHGVAQLEVHLRADTDVLYRRYRARFVAGDRHPGHVAFETVDEFREELNDSVFPAVGFGSTLELDTTQTWPDTEAVASWITGHLA